MKSVVEPLEGNKVKLSIEVDEQEFEKDIDSAFRQISREVRIPGFRPGKAPRRILEARLGKELGRERALQDALPGYYSKAVREHEVDVVAPAQLEMTGGQESGPVSFDAVVEVRPQIHIPGYKGLRVVIPSPVAGEADIDAHIDRLRGNFGELAVVDRPSHKGDFVTIDLQASHEGEPVSGLTTDDFLYEVGSGSVLPELDDQLDGAKVGDILAFEADVPGTGAAEFKVLVKEIKEKQLPELTDEWASEASEFETVEELRADITKRMSLVKRVQATMALRNATVEALVELVAEDPPASMVDSEVQRQLHDLSHRLESQGASLTDYLQATGQSGEELVGMVRQQAIPAVKADLALRAVAEAEAIEPTEDDIEAEIERLAGGYQMKPAQLRRELERSDQMTAVRSDWKKTKALEWLIEHVEIVDTEGELVDRSLLDPDLESLEGTGEPDARADQEGTASEGTADTTGGTPDAGEPGAAAEQVSGAVDAEDQETGHQ